MTLDIRPCDRCGELYGYDPDEYRWASVAVHDCDRDEWSVYVLNGYPQEAQTADAP
jgi:hypothetical protein